MAQPRPTRSQLLDAWGIFVELLRQDAAERAWQNFFGSHPFVLSESLPLRLVPDDVRSFGRPGRDEPDFILTPSRGSRFDGVGVIELKRPNTHLLRIPRKNVVTLSASADTALKQCAYYLQQLATPLPPPSSGLCIGIREHVFIIAGLSDEIRRKTQSELLRAQVDRLLPAGYSLLPFDSLLKAFEASIPYKVHLLVPRRLTRHDLHRAVSALTELERQVLYARAERLNWKQIAEVVGISAKQAQSVAKRAIATVQRRLGDPHFAQELLGANEK